MKPLKSKVSISLDEDVIRLSKELADLDDRTLSSFINLILKRYIKTCLKEKRQYGAGNDVDLSVVTFLENADENE